MQPYSILISTYCKDTPEALNAAISSCYFNQNPPPDEIILVIDGNISSNLQNTIRECQKQIPCLKTISLENNTGLGNALRVGLLRCSNEYVARMDADDISVENRFAMQTQFLDNHPEIAVVGGQIAEFFISPENIQQTRIVPISPEDCRKQYINRDPLNHMSVMFRKSAVIDAGNYIHWYLNEDSFLWGRMLKAGYQFANLPRILVNVRTDNSTFARRGGWKYFLSSYRIIIWKYKNNFGNLGHLAFNITTRIIVQLLMPTSIRKLFFKIFLRRKIKSSPLFSSTLPQSPF